LESLRKGGTEAFVEHFFSDLASKAISITEGSQETKNMKCIRNKIPTWKAAYEIRQEFHKAASPAEKGRILDLCMQSEKIRSNGLEGKCLCNLCSFLEFRVLPHPNAPIGTLYSSGIYESFEKHIKLTENFSMSQLCYKNMLSMLDSSYDGVSFPGLYLGTKHTIFPLHVEDLSLWSFNFLLFGFPKFW